MAGIIIPGVFPLRAILSSLCAFVLWTSAVAWAYGGSPTSRALVLFMAPCLPPAVGLVVLAFLRGRDLPKAAAVLLPLALGALGFWGASELRLRQEVAALDLPRIYLDRRASAPDWVPRSSLKHDPPPGRGITIEGRIANDNDFALWEVTLEVRIFYEDGGEAFRETLRVPGDIPGGGSGPVAWRTQIPARFVEEEIPSFDVRVAGAKRHWGGEEGT